MMLKVLSAYSLRVIEDCAQSHGAKRHGTRCDSLADHAPFSFYPTKILGTYGDGGMVLASDARPPRWPWAFRRLAAGGLVYAGARALP